MQAPGTFTVWYVERDSRGDITAERYEQGITATSPNDLLAKVRALCPEGMTAQTINWQNGGTMCIWYALAGKPDAEHWHMPTREWAFGE